MSKSLTATALQALILSKFDGTKYNGPNFECAETGDLIEITTNEGTIGCRKVVEFENGQVEHQVFPQFARFKALSHSQHFVEYDGDIPAMPEPVDPAAAANPVKKKASSKKK